MYVYSSQSLYMEDSIQFFFLAFVYQFFVYINVHEKMLIRQQLVILIPENFARV